MSLPGEREEGGTASNMSLPGEREDGGTASDMSLPGEREDGGTASDKHPSDENTYLRVRCRRPVSPVVSCVSMKSVNSMLEPIEFKQGPLDKQGIRSRRPVSPVVSCVSMKSVNSMLEPIEFKQGPLDKQGHISEEVMEDRADSHGTSCVSMKSDNSKLEPKEFRDGILDKQGDWSRAEDHYRCTDDTIVRCLQRAVENHKGSLKRRFEHVIEGSRKAVKATLLNKIYTDLYITEGENEGVNNEHEVWQLERASRRQITHDTPINYNDLFEPLPGQEISIRTVLTVGVPGIGKTVCVQKSILDWAEGKANQDVEVMFVLPFRELNLIRHVQYSLIQLLKVFHPELHVEDAKQLSVSKAMFIFDGLDETRLPLNFRKNQRCCDVTESTSVDVLLTNLIQGNLLPSALLWITSRPAAANQIPSECVDRLTEVQGFNDAQKEEYFMKRIRDENLARRIISHIKTSRSLYIMCHMPVFSWISSTVLEHMLSTEKQGEMPKTLTEMYTHFLLIQTQLKSQKYQGENKTDQEEPLRANREVLLKLGKLAFDNLEKGNLMFYEEDLKECGLDVKEAAVFSGVCTEIFQEESVLFQRAVYCFVHLSIQEFFSAVYMYHCYETKNMDALKPFQWKPISNEEHNLYWSLRLVDEAMSEELSLSELLMGTVDKALQSKNGHLDLLVRFLHGLSLESNQRLLRGLLVEIERSPESIDKTSRFLKEMQKTNISPERSINLLHCLMEMNDHSVQQEIQAYMRKKTSTQLTPIQCSALAYMLQMSEEVLDEFDLNKYDTSEEGWRRLIPAVKVCRKAILNVCQLNEASYEVVASALSSNPSNLRELYLSNNDLQDSGMKLLSAGLGSPHCKLETLRLIGCRLTEACCSLLASAFSSNSSHLKQLDLSNNDLQDSGVKLLSAGLGSLEILEILRLSSCRLTERCCSLLTSALTSKSSHLRELDLSNNDLQDLGVRLLSAGLGNLHTLRLSGCLVTEEGCVSLASAMRSNPSQLRELDLSFNHPGDSGVKLLSAGLEDPHWRLDKLNVDHGGECRIRPGLGKYACDLTLDPNTAYRYVSLSDENRTVTYRREKQPYPDHPERFEDCNQVLCREGLSGRCYWETERSGGGVRIAVAYKGISRGGGGCDCVLGYNDKSWSLECYDDHYAACHSNKYTVIPDHPSGSSRVGVYLDWPAGSLSFYTVSSDTLTHLHTFTSTFTEPLYAGFRVVYDGSSVTLCQVK